MSPRSLRIAIAALACSSLALSSCANAESSRDAASDAGDTVVSQATSGTDDMEVPTVDPAQPALPAQFTGDDGVDITVTDLDRVLVLDDVTIEIMDALGHADKIGIAPETSAHDAILGQSERITTAGSGALTVEGVVALRPTLVIGTNMRRHADLIAGLQDADVPATLIDRSQDAPDIITKTAAVIGLDASGRDLAEQVQQQIATAEANADSLDDSERRRVMVLSSSGAGDSGNTTAAGADTPADQVITFAGGINTGAETGLDRYQAITAEGLIAARPDVIVVAESELDDLGGEAGIWQQVAGLQGTTAAEDKALIVMPDSQIRVAGVHTGIGAVSLQNQLYPDL
ncbi:MAG TPA: ABC transporter substrate-binding protein [Candidatus Dietzia intestinigallinarum]|nr:ABC transporter substrate-binding protein [Candidatus Dietzia intestinigallinarum]